MDQAVGMTSWEQWLNGSSGEVVEDTETNPRYPNGIIVAILMAIGLVGNSLVLYVYHFKMEHTVFTTFVIFLAGLDLTTTLTSMPLDVVLKCLRMEKTAAMEVICKMAHFQVYTCSLASGSLLLLIAATRCSKVCRPTQPAWTLRQARVRCLLIVLVAMALCTVSLVINGMEKVKISTGVQHFPRPENSSLMPTQAFYPGNLTSNSSLEVNKMLPGHKDVAFEHESHNNTWEDLLPEHPELNSSHVLSKPKVVEVYICRASEQQKGTALYYALYGLLMAAYVTICLALLILHCRISSTLVRFKRQKVRKGSVWSHQDQHNLNHITGSMFRIFVAITVIFVLSYLPHLACVVAQRVLFKPGEAMPRTTRIFLDLAYNFPYINVIANPFIYGFMSKRFRAYCLHLLCFSRCCRH
ncbi:hypothetical protein ACOMHN_017070 [Nucella lapillus]